MEEVSIVGTEEGDGPGFLVHIRRLRSILFHGWRTVFAKRRARKVGRFVQCPTPEPCSHHDYDVELRYIYLTFREPLLRSSHYRQRR